MHEIGHAMGMSVGNYSFALQSTEGTILFSDRLPYAGSVAPLACNNTGFIPHFDCTKVAYGSLMSGLNADERRIPSELDIIANAQVSGYTILSLTPSIQYQPVPIAIFPDFGASIWTRFGDYDQDFKSKSDKTRTGLNPLILIWRR